MKDSIIRLLIHSTRLLSHDVLSTVQPVGDRTVKDRISLQLQLVYGSSILSSGLPGHLVATLGQDGVKCTN